MNNQACFIVDAARDAHGTHLLLAKEFAPVCLFTGKPLESQKSYAPFLLDNIIDPDLLDVVKSNWGNSFGIFLYPKLTFAKSVIFEHLSNLIVVYTEDGRKLYFRFYDPRVLRIFLPTCDAGQLKEFFGPIEQFICEDEDPQFALVFSLVGSQLQTKRIPAEDVFRDLAVQATVAEVPSVTTEVQGIVESSKPTPPAEEPPSPKRRFFVD